ncbi:MAG: glycosyltransferase [bacterium]|nr:glycosyltransferase [bacterium]
MALPEKILVEFCLPIYNEEKIIESNVERLIKHLRQYDSGWFWKIVLITNGCTDNSWTVANKLTRLYPGLISAVNFPLAGRGRALRQYYITSQADVLAYMDIDLAVSLDNIPPLINPIINNQADLTIGSRLLHESKIERSFLRELSSQSYNFLSRLILRHHLSDLQCGFKAIRTDVFKKISSYIQDDRWFFDTEMIAYCLHLGYCVKELPVDWSENRWNQRKSKVNLIKDSLKFIYKLIELKIRLTKKPLNKQPVEK